MGWLGRSLISGRSRQILANNERRLSVADIAL